MANNSYTGFLGLTRDQLIMELVEHELLNIYWLAPPPPLLLSLVKRKLLSQLDQAMHQ